MIGTAKGVMDAIRRRGGIHNLPEVGGEWLLEGWTGPLPLSEAMEREVRRSLVEGKNKITLNFDIKDAALFAAWLRRQA